MPADRGRAQRVLDDLEDRVERLPITAVLLYWLRRYHMLADGPDDPSLRAER